MNTRHMKYMLYGGAGILVALLLGVPLTVALPYAILLACPLMMASMMLMAGRGGGHRDRCSGPDGSTGRRRGAKVGQ